MINGAFVFISNDNRIYSSLNYEGFMHPIDFGTEAICRLQNVCSLSDFFAAVKGFDALHHRYCDKVSTLVYERTNQFDIEDDEEILDYTFDELLDMRINAWNSDILYIKNASRFPLSCVNTQGEHFLVEAGQVVTAYRGCFSPLTSDTFELCS